MRSKYLSPNFKPSAPASTNGSVKGQQPPRDRNHDRKNMNDPSHPNSSLLKYFAENPPVEEEVDIDFALNDHALEEADGPQVAANNYPVKY